MATGVETVRGLGQASIGTDKPTRDKLKAAAKAAGLHLSEYLRILADSSIKDLQGGLTLPGVKPKDDSQRISALSQQSMELSKAIPMSASRRNSVLSLVNRHIQFNDLRHSELLFSKMTDEFETMRAKQGLKEAGQLEWELSLV